mmetsp:Transcript_57391/g.92986  ORF Transcript_57391/g.92986 Transcript_57391/m.92986 type:complete len:295 (-) Transcript_57391:40-924(-)
MGAVRHVLPMAPPASEDMTGAGPFFTATVGSLAATAKISRDDPTPLFLYFADVTEADLARMAATGTKEVVRQILQECMKIDQPEGPRAEILLDLHYHNYSFCMSKGFPPEKTSTVLSMMKIVLEGAVRQRLTAEAAFDLFEDWLLKHSIERPPRSVGIFSFDDVKSIVEYATNTFFRHYRLYMYAFMTHCDVRLRVDEPGGGAAPLVIKPLPMRMQDEVDPMAQPELANLFRQSEEEMAEAEIRRIRELQEQQQEDPRAAMIKRRVAEGLKSLMENFEGKLKEQDERFTSQVTK